MENQPDSMAILVACQAARHRDIDNRPPNDSDLIIMLAIYYGYQTIGEISAFKAFVYNRKIAWRTVGKQVSITHRIGLVEITKKKRLTGPHPKQFLYRLTARGMAIMSDMRSELANVLRQEWNIDQLRDVVNYGD